MTPHSALRDPTATWRVRRALPLHDALQLAARLKLGATIESRVVARVLHVDVALEGETRPSAVTVLSREPRGITASSPRETAADSYEARLSVPAADLMLVLRLSNETESRLVSLLTGDHAALLVHGWGEHAIGALAEVQVPGPALAAAIAKLCADCVQD